MKKTWLIAHHSAVTGRGHQFDRIDSYHKSKRFPESALGYFVGYMYVIEKTGKIRQARDESETGAHTVAKGLNLNRDGIGVCMAGDFSKELPTEAQLDAWLKLGSAIIERWGIDPQKIVNHNDVKPTSCPGFPFADYLRDHWRRSKAIIRTPKYLSPHARVKRLRRAIMRSQGTRRRTLERKLERLLLRLAK